MNEDDRQGHTNYDWINGMRVGILAGGIGGILLGIVLGGFQFVGLIVGGALGGYLGAKSASRW